MTNQNTRSGIQAISHLMGGRCSASALANELTCSQLCLPKGLKQQVCASAKRGSVWKHLGERSGAQKNEVAWWSVQTSAVFFGQENNWVRIYDCIKLWARSVWCRLDVVFHCTAAGTDCLEKKIMITLQLWSKIWLIFPSWLIPSLWPGR